MRLSMVLALTSGLGGAGVVACDHEPQLSGTPYRPDRDSGPQPGDPGGGDSRRGDPRAGDPYAPSDPGGADPGGADPGGGDAAGCVDESIGPEWQPCTPISLHTGPLAAGVAYQVTWGDTTHASAAYAVAGCSPVCLASEYCGAGPSCWLHNQVDIAGTACVDAFGGNDDIFVFEAGVSGDARIQIADKTSGSATDLSVFLVLAYWDSCQRWLCSNTLFGQSGTGYLVDCEFDDGFLYPDFTAPVSAGYWYYVIVDGEDGPTDKGQYVLTVTMPSP